MKTAMVIAALLVASACGGDDGGGSGAVDAGAADAMVEDFTTCAGDCAALAVTANFDGTTRDLERAYFGLTSPGQSGSGQWEVYVEGYRGGDDGCPTETAATPDQTLIVSGMLIPSEPGNGVVGSSTLLDFEGALLELVPNASATTVSIVWVAADPCVACTEGTEADRDDRFVSFDLSATFEGGSVGGRVYATHCDSLDAL